MYLFAYRPEDAPPASKPPGLKMSAASLGLPLPPNEGIWKLVAAFWINNFALNPTAAGFTFEGSAKTLGKPTNVYANTASFVMVGLNTWVRVPVIESERFLPFVGLGYGTWSDWRHHNPTGNGCVSRCML